MNIRPKTFRAVVNFSVAGRSFAPGDVVDGLALDVALQRGDRFVAADPSSRKKLTRPAEDADPTTPNSIDGDVDDPKENTP